MKRQDKYPDTDTFTYYNANPKNKVTTDCWLRAISTGLNKDYVQVLREMVEVSIKTGYEVSDKRTIEKYLAANNFVKMKQPRKYDNTKYTGSEWCNHLNSNGYTGNIIAMIGGHHIVAIKPTNSDGLNKKYKIHDTWNSSYKCIGNYYIKMKGNV